MLVTEVISNDFGISRNGVGQIVQGEHEINQEIFIVCMTSKGTDPFRPDFGCDAVKSIDAPITEIKAKMVAAIIDCISIYIPRITIDRILSNISGGQITFTIIYILKNTANTGQTDVTYGLG